MVRGEPATRPARQPAAASASGSRGAPLDPPFREGEGLVVATGAGEVLERATTAAAAEEALLHPLGDAGEGASRRPASISFEAGDVAAGQVPAAQVPGGGRRGRRCCGTAGDMDRLAEAGPPGAAPPALQQRAGLSPRFRTPVVPASSALAPSLGRPAWPSTRMTRNQRKERGAQRQAAPEHGPAGSAPGRSGPLSSRLRLAGIGGGGSGAPLKSNCRPRVCSSAWCAAASFCSDALKASGPRAVGQVPLVRGDQAGGAMA